MSDNKFTYQFYGPITEYRYEFLSVIVEKEITKIVRLSETDIEDTYNLVLLDMQSDGSESNEQESEMFEKGKSYDYFIISKR